MITFDRTLVGALQPPLGQAEQPVYAGQQLMGLQPLVREAHYHESRVT